LSQLISPPALMMPPASGKPCSTSRRMVTAAVCQPLAANPPNRALPGHSEAFRLGPVEPDERLEEDVLHRVLLEAVEPARPVDDPIEFGLGPDAERTAEAMHDTIVPLVDDVHDGDAPERPGVVRLSAAGGVEGRTVEEGRGPSLVLGQFEKARPEAEQVAVGEVEAFGHGWLLSPPAGGM
jgi:hypothetical protein